MSALEYPATRTVDAVEELAGVTAPDPYRWLEDGTSEEVRLWQKEQNELASGYVRSWPGFDRLRDIVTSMSAARFGAIPRKAGGQWFRSFTPDGATQASVVVSAEPFGTGRVVLDPRAHADDSGTVPFLSWLSPSPDGTLLAVGLCPDGSEQNVIRVVEVASGELLAAPEGRLMDSWSGGVAWLPDSSGFYATLIDGAAIDLAQRIVHFDVASATTTQIPVDLDLLDSRDYRMVQPSWDGKHLVLYAALMTVTPLAVAELDNPAAPQWRRFVAPTGVVIGGHLIGSTYYAMTDLDSPRGRIVAIDLEHPEPSSWRTIVAESDAVLRTITPVGGDRLYVTAFLDTYARVTVIDLEGNQLDEIELPGKGAISEQPFPYMNVPPRGDRDSFLFAFSSLVSSWGVYQHQPSTGEVIELETPVARLVDCVVEDHWATSADGTRVPYHLVRKASVDTTTVMPTLIYAYGGFNAPWVPQFPGAMAAFVEAGGVFVHGHLRGGAELGRDWWEGGRLANKQNCYADLYAIAEDLIAQGRATSETLAISGGSNGGLLSGVAVTQRPDLFAVSVPRVPLLDVIGACRENYGRYAVSIEFGDVEDPDEVRRLMTFSPYHLVTDRAYPSVFIDAGDTDPRCSPWHARKLGARMQAAQRGDAPILVRIWENVGHGWATDKAIAIEQSTEWIGFVCKELGISL